MHRVAAIIPARFNSARFPGKPLALLKGKPIIQHVYENAEHASLVHTVIIATDDKRIYDAVHNFGGEAVMTSDRHTSGTDRIAEVAENMACEFVVNVQGDEPFIRPEMIDDVVDLLYNDDIISISTLAKRITGVGEILSPHVVKVVMDDEGYAMYFSRAPIPFCRDEWHLRRTENRAQNTDIIDEFELRTPNPEQQKFYCYKHIGIYGFKKADLVKFASMKKNEIEDIEKLEQLRALAAGMKIKVKETEYDTFGIDTIEDLRKAEEWQSISL